MELFSMNFPLLIFFGYDSIAVFRIIEVIIFSTKSQETYFSILSLGQEFGQKIPPMIKYSKYKTIIS